MARGFRRAFDRIPVQPPASDLVAEPLGRRRLSQRLPIRPGFD